MRTYPEPNYLITMPGTQGSITPAPTHERLERAAALVELAAMQGATLIMLPELFNTGYRYSDDNYLRIETRDRPTMRWLKETAARLKIHLAGSWLVRDSNDIYNRLTLAAPDRHTWQYDKKYPWAWERAYFRGRRNVTVADTDLGRIGMLLCWDVAHPGLWRQYAGQVDLMLIASCPPDATRPIYHLPDGKDVTFDNLGPMMHSLKQDGQRVFKDGIQQQVAWLGVPCVNSSGCGDFISRLPNPGGSLLLLNPFAPWLAKYLGMAAEIRMRCEMIPAGCILASDGLVLAQASADQGEGFIQAEVELSVAAPIPTAPQPRRQASW